MALVPLLAILGMTAAHPPDLIGTYRADVSRAPKTSRGTLQAIFGSSRLRLSSGGRFALCGLRSTGFWRNEQGKVVLVQDGFFGAPFAIPDEVLKRSWPKNNLFGYVLKRSSDGRLFIESVGQSKGPIEFIRLPSRSTKQLVIESRLDENEMLSESAYYELADELPTRWRELAGLIVNSELPYRDRSWAAQIWHGPAKAEVVSAMLDSMEHMAKGELTESQARLIRRNLGSNACKIATKAQMPRLLRLAERGIVSQSNVAEAVERIRYEPAKPYLIEWLKSEQSYVRSFACLALAAISAKETIGQMQKLTKDPEAVVRVRANSALLKLSSNINQQRECVHRLSSELKGEWLTACDAAEALGQSGMKEAVIPLAAALQGKGIYFIRRDAAKALGALGFAEAVPALLQAKTVSGMPHGFESAMNSQAGSAAAKFSDSKESVIDLAIVQKEVVEALWKLDRKRRTNKLKRS